MVNFRSPNFKHIFMYFKAFTTGMNSFGGRLNPEHHPKCMLWLSIPCYFWNKSPCHTFSRH